MKTKRSILTMTLSSLALIFVNGCVQEVPAPTEESAVVLEDVQPSSPYSTKGRIDISQLEGWMEGEVEILILNDFPEALRQSLTQQQDLLRAYIAEETREDRAEPEETAEDENYMHWLEDRDRESLNASLTELKKQYPDPIESTFETRSGASRTYNVRDAVHSRYKPMVEAIRVDTLPDDLNALFDQLREDYEVLKAQAEGRGEFANQARADIRWMAIFTDPYLQEYVSLVRRLETLQRSASLRMRREARAQQRSGGSSQTAPTRQSPRNPAEAWEQFMFENERQIDTHLFSLTAESDFADENGRFQLEAKGQVVARIFVKGRSVYFPATFEDMPVNFSEIEVINKEQ